MQCAGSRLGAASPRRPRRVAEVTSTPWAGSSTALASGRSGRASGGAARHHIRALDPLDRQPVDEIGIGRPADPAQQRDPGGQRPRRQARPLIAPSTRARAWRVEPVGRILEHRLQPPAKRRQRLGQRFERFHRRGRRRRPACRRARPARSRAHSPPPAPWPGRRPCRAPRRARLDGPNGSPSAKPLQASRPTAAPAPPRPPLRAPARPARHSWRHRAAAPQPPPPPARLALGPTIQRRISIASRPVSAAEKVESAASNR